MSGVRVTRARTWLLLALILVLCPAVSFTATMTGNIGDPVSLTGPNELDVQILKQNGVIVGTSTPNLYIVRTNQSLSAGTTIQHASRVDVIETVQISSTTGAVTSTATPRIAAGVNGQIILVQGTSAANTYTLPDGNGVKLENTSAITFTDRTSVFFTYLTSLAAWRQDGSVDVPPVVRLPAQLAMIAANAVTVGTANDPKVMLFKQIGAASAITLSSNPQIQGCTTDGQVLVLDGTSDTNTVTFIDGNGLALASGGGRLVMTSRVRAMFICDTGSGLWEQLQYAPPTQRFRSQATDPNPPPANELELYNKAGSLFTRDEAGNVVGPLGVGGGGSSTDLTAQLVTTSNITLSGEKVLETITTNNSPVFVNAQSTPSENGLYISSGSAWTRAAGATAGTAFTRGTVISISDGLTTPVGNKGSTWVYTVSGVYGTNSPTAIKSGQAGAAELLINKSTGAAAVNNGYIGADATGQVPYTRIGSFAQHAALSNSSQITVTARQMGIEGSAPGINLTSAPQIVPGTANQEVEFIGTHATNTVQLDNGDGVRLCENRGSVIIGLNGAKPIFRYNTTLTAWEQIGCTGGASYGHTDLVSAYKWCNTPNGDCLNIFGSTMQGTSAGAAINDTRNIPATKKAELLYNGTVCETVDTATGSPVHSYSNLCKPRKPIAFKAIALEPDGTNCTAHAAVTVNGGPKETLFKCADSINSKFFGSIPMLDSGWDAGAVRFTLTVYHQTTETLTYAGDFSAQCKAPNETVDDTWSTGVAADVAITTAHQFPRATTSDVTPVGSCGADDVIFFRYVVDAANFSTNAANSWIYSVTMTYLQSTRNGDN